MYKLTGACIRFTQTALVEIYKYLQMYKTSVIHV